LLELAGSAPATGMDGISLATCFAQHNTCPQLDAFNETGIWITDIPGLPDRHLRYPDLLELIEVMDRESGTLSIKSDYASRIMEAKDRMVRQGRWKLVYQPLEEGHILKLFDVINDPTCQHDLSAQHTDVVHELWGKLDRFIAGKKGGAVCCQGQDDPAQIEETGVSTP
jgi:hypothetical protein